MSEHTPQQWFDAALSELHPRERTRPDGRRVIVQAAPSPRVLAEALIIVLGPEPMTLAECRQLMQFQGKERVDAALDLARADARVSVAEERRPDRAGRLRKQVVMRRA
jgi:hypothetical protein